MLKLAGELAVGPLPLRSEHCMRAIATPGCSLGLSRADLAESAFVTQQSLIPAITLGSYNLSSPSSPSTPPRPCLQRSSDLPLPHDPPGPGQDHASFQRWSMQALWTLCQAKALPCFSARHPLMGLCAWRLPMLRPTGYMRLSNLSFNCLHQAVVR